MIKLHEAIVIGLLEGMETLTEDRIDAVIQQYPDAKLTRDQVNHWFEYDPTANHKYIPWIVRQVATKNLKLPTQGEALRDDLMTLERLLKIPAYKGPRDLYQISTFSELQKVIKKHGNLRSKTSSEKAKKARGGKVAATEGRYSLVKITDPDTLVSWAWKAYSKDNPNWKEAPVLPVKGMDGPSDGLWCVRFPRYANTYLSSDPFYLVLKDGGPYVGMVISRGECQTLRNRGIDTAQAYEIFPVVKSLLANQELTGNCKVFGNIRFLEHDVKPGETVAGPISLKNTPLDALPNNLTIKGGELNVSYTPLAQLPSALRVEGTLKIQGTPITELPTDLYVEDMEWSAPLTWEKIKIAFYHNRKSDMREGYCNHAAMKDLPPEQKEREWEKFQPELQQYFLTDPNIDKSIRTMYREVPLERKNG
jgi:hypothetical protein